MKNKGTMKKQIIAATEREKEGEYWKNKLSGEWEKSYFSYDSEIKEAGPGKNTAAFKFTGEIYIRLRQISKESDYTLNIILQTVLIALLGKYTGNSDIVLGTVIYKQEKQGEYINTVLALRNPSGDTLTFKELLYQVRQTLVEANENQSYPIGVLVDQLNIPKTRAGDFPLFDVAILLENIHDKSCLQSIKHNMTFSFLRENESVNGIVEYTSSKYNRTTIERIISHFTRLLREAVKNVEIPVSLINILSEEETRQLLTEFNDTAAAYPRHSTIHQLFAEQIETNPEHIAVKGIVYGELADHVHLTYRELNEKSHGLACMLEQKGMQAEDIAGIMVERSIEMIISILGILKAGGAYMPIDPGYPRERIKYMLADSRSKILLSSREEIEKWNGMKENFVNCQLLMVNEKSSYCRRFNSPTQVANSINDNQLTVNSSQLKQASLAYIIYTSGTTGQPKGTVIEHGNVVRLLFNDKFPFDFSNNDKWSLFHSYCFDFSVWEMYGALLYGGILVIIPKMISKDPKLFLDILEKEGITVLNQTPSAFYHLVKEGFDYANREIKMGIRYVIFGGEMLRPGKLKKWKEKYPGVKIINMFGITETTVHVTFKEINDKEIENNISNIGKPIPTLTTYVLDKNLNPLPIGVAGELCVGGKGVSRGYLNRPELTGEKFVKSLLKGGGRLYKSGDLARFLESGDMEYLGRIDHQVKIRGFRIELGEIESQLLKYNEVNEAVVVIKKDETGDKHLCAYVVPVKEFNIPQLREFLSGTLADYMIPSYFVPLEKIPLTTSGKVDREALAVEGAKLDTGSRYEAPRDELEKTIATIWQEVLKVEKVGIHDNFFELGGDSFKAMTLARKFSDWRGERVSIALIFENQTIAEFAREFAGKSPRQKEGLTIKPVEKKHGYPLASAQERYYIMEQLSGTSMSYHIPTAVQMQGRIEKKKLETAMNQLIQRHESLRTSFQTVGEEVLQIIHDRVEFKLEKYTAARGKQEVEEIAKNFPRPFDLARAPLFRAGLIDIEPGTHILMIDMHHLITDGVSAGVFIGDFTALYAGQDLPAIRVRYKDYARWQDKLTGSKEIKKQEDYWLECFKGEIPRLNMPVDFPGPGENQYKGSTIQVEMEPRLVNGIKRLIKETASTLNIVFMAAYAVLLSKYTGQEEIIIGTLTTGRNHEEIQNIIGLFINSLAIRNFPGEDKIFEIYLNEVKKNMLQAYENQDYQFNDLVWKLGDRVDTRGTPLYSTIITIQNIEIPPLEIPGLELTPYPLGQETSKFPFYFDVYHSDETIELAMKYSTALYKSSTAERIVSDYIQVLDQVVKKREIRIKDIKISMNSEEIETNIFKDEPGEFNF